MKQVNLHVLLCALASAYGCGGSNGEVTLTTYGENYIEVGIPPATEASPDGIVDGWRVTYDEFLIVLADIELGDGDETVLSKPQARVFDMTQSGPHIVFEAQSVPSGDLPQVRVGTRPANDAIAGNATQDQVARMNAGGWSVHVQGRAERAGVTKTFSWGFTLSTQYRDCRDADEKLGLLIPTGGSVLAELTIHGDHLFYDDLQASEAVMRFDAIAGADTDMDGEVTPAELAGVDLTVLPPTQYGTGGDGRVLNLGQFIRDQTRTLVHFNGEGHCQAEN